ncbi:MAG TPA: alkaline phosphatase family protein, partial [Gemmataceae bacterium]|nr:alkaline phosphatase family protein [Gemmataceae bacterium]
VPTNQVLKPAGKQVTFPGRPVDLALADDGRTLVVKNMRSLVFIDVATAKVKQTLALREIKPPPFNAEKDPIAPTGKPPTKKYPVGFSVVGLLVRGEHVYATDSEDHLRVARRQKDGSYAWADPIALFPPKVGGYVFPAGIAALSGEELWVCSSRGNTVQLVNLKTGQAEQAVAVGVAPYMVCCPRPDRAYVTNWGGDPPKPGDPQALSSGSPVRIDPKTGAAGSGTVSVLGRMPGKWKQVRSLRVGLHPSGMAPSPGGKFLYVANANSDTVSVIDTRNDEVVETIPCRPEARLPFGSGANAVAVSPDGRTLYVANGTNNCVAVVRLGRRSAETEVKEEKSALLGLIPTAWYPGALLLSADGKKLFVANVKGVGSLSQPRPVAEGKNTHDFLGSVSILDVPDAKQLAKYTAEVNANNRLGCSLAGLEKPRPDAKPAPVPERHGEPSVFKHVIYVIKENRSYDQILGDMKEGNGDPALCLFGEEVTPNQHKLAREFTLFDNFYCNGALSATGHEWTDAAYVTDYLEKAFGGFTRSYPVDGDDALAFASTGFLWDNALARKRTFRNFGEFTKTTYDPAGATWADVYADHKNGTRKVKINVKPNLQSLVPHTHPGYPGFPLVTPDAYRADLFLEYLKACDRKGEFPNLVYLFLPCNHTVGTTPGFPTPRAMIADNDRALGRIVEAVSKSRFWESTCIFVVEDDPQFGFDHVDGHRSVLQVISPYTKRKFKDSTNYNQTGVVKTIELILGLPPMNQLDLSATPIRACFRDRPDPAPYTAVPNRVPLDDMNPGLSRLTGPALYWAKKSLEMDFDEEDEADEDTLNRVLWHS